MGSGDHTALSACLGGGWHPGKALPGERCLRRWQIRPGTVTSAAEPGILGHVCSWTRLEARIINLAASHGASLVGCPSHVVRKEKSPVVCLQGPKPA